MVKARGRGTEKSYLRKGSWNPEEDRKLIAYIRRYGIWNWSEMPKYAGLLRCGKSCRLRWMNYLRPNIKRGNFTQEEDETIIKLHQELGNRWSAIASKLSGRTDNDIKNHWHTRLKKRLIKNNQQLQHKVPSINKSLQDTQTTNQPLLIPNNSLTSPQLSADEIYKIHSPYEAFNQLHNIWEDSCMMHGYGATYTDPGFMVSTSLWGFEQDYVSPSASNFDADEYISGSIY